MAFFFYSAVATQEKRKAKSKAKAKGKEEGEDSDKSNDETVTSSQVASTTSQEWIAEHSSIVDKKLCPAVVYWIALTTNKRGSGQSPHSSSSTPRMWSRNACTSGT